MIFKLRVKNYAELPPKGKWAELDLTLLIGQQVRISENYNWDHPMARGFITGFKVEKNDLTLRVECIGKNNIRYAREALKMDKSLGIDQQETTVDLAYLWHPDEDTLPTAIQVSKQGAAIPYSDAQEPHNEDEGRRTMPEAEKDPLTSQNASSGSSTDGSSTAVQNEQPSEPPRDPKLAMVPVYVYEHSPDDENVMKKRTCYALPAHTQKYLWMHYFTIGAQWLMCALDHPAVDPNFSPDFDYAERRNYHTLRETDLEQPEDEGQKMKRKFDDEGHVDSDVEFHVHQQRGERAGRKCYYLTRENGDVDPFWFNPRTKMWTSCMHIDHGGLIDPANVIEMKDELADESISVVNNDVRMTQVHSGDGRVCQQVMDGTESVFVYRDFGPGCNWRKCHRVHRAVPEMKEPMIGEVHLDIANERLQLAKTALVATGYFKEDEIGDDIAPRITELWSHAEEEIDKLKNRVIESEKFELVYQHSNGRKCAYDYAKVGWKITASEMEDGRYKGMWCNMDHTEYFLAEDELTQEQAMQRFVVSYFGGDSVRAAGFLVKDTPMADFARVANENIAGSKDKPPYPFQSAEAMFQHHPPIGNHICYYIEEGEAWWYQPDGGADPRKCPHSHFPGLVKEFT